MGACSFINQVKAKTAEEGFKRLYDEAVWEHGHDAYNGTISTCCLKGHCMKTFPGLPSKENRDAAYVFIDEHDNGEKWCADWVDVGFDSETGLHEYWFYGWAAE